MTLQVTDRDVAAWLSSKSLFGDATYSQTFNFTLKAAPIHVSFNSKILNVFSSWKTSEIKDYVNAEFKTHNSFSSTSYPRPHDPAFGYLDWSFELGSNLINNLEVLPEPEHSSWTPLSKTFKAQETFVFNPVNTANDDLTTNVTYRDGQNNVIRFGTATAPLYLA